MRVKWKHCFGRIYFLLRAHLFPATPKQPQLVFCFKLFDWYEALLLECQVAVQDFVSALNVLTSSNLLQVRS